METVLQEITDDFKQLDRLYEINDEAFPEEERIPSEMLLSVMRQFGCVPLAFMHGDRLVGFTGLVPDPEDGVGYMWYFAIARDMRGRGIGSAALQLLQKQYSNLQLVLDMEQIDPDAPNYRQRLSRLRFYERNGFSRAMVGMSYFGMDFEIMCNRPPFRIDAFRRFLAKSPSKRWHPVLYPLER